MAVFSFDSVAPLVVVAVFWGATNPFLKKGAVGLENVRSSSRIRQFLKELAFLITNLKYIVPFAINQIGSLLYILTLGNVDLSLAVPVSNSLTFLVTAITGWILGEEKVDRRTYMGAFLILLGTLLCSIDKTNTSVES